jgi:hypothetical protein
VKDIKSKFEQLNGEQTKWHIESARAQENDIGTYKSNEVIYDFGDGWKVVYVPAAGEIEEFPGIPNSSYDRVLEGNKNGLCLGGHNALYQSNDSGKIYSVRTPDNEPAVTIRITKKYLSEAKGKNNLTPSFEGALHTKKWLKSLEDIDFENSPDYKNFPPLDKEEALEEFLKDPMGAYLDGWISSWYRKGVPEIDQDIDERIANNDGIIIRSGLAKKYKEAVEPVIEYYANIFLEEPINIGVRNPLFFGDYFNPPIHESWKTYKKNPIMVKAVRKFIKYRLKTASEFGIHTIPEYRDYFMEEILNDPTGKYPTGKSSGVSKSELFFVLKLDDIYPEEVLKLGRELAESDPRAIFDSEGFDDPISSRHPELIQMALPSLLKKSPKRYIKYVSSLDPKYISDKDIKAVDKALLALAKNEPLYLLNTYFPSEGHAGIYGSEDKLLQKSDEYKNELIGIALRTIAKNPLPGGNISETYATERPLAFLYYLDYYKSDINLENDIINEFAKNLLKKLWPGDIKKFPDDWRKLFRVHVAPVLTQGTYREIISENQGDILRDWGLVRGEDEEGFFPPDLLPEEGPISEREIPIGESIESIHTPEDYWANNDLQHKLVDRDKDWVPGEATAPTPPSLDYDVVHRRSRLNVLKSLEKIASDLDSRGEYYKADIIERAMIRMAKEIHLNHSGAH